jgi:hypothetical protein
MARVIRRMCAFRAEERYQSAAEVMMELAAVSEGSGTTLSPEMLELVDSATETYREEKIERDVGENADGRPKTRAQRREEQRHWNRYYREESAKYFLALTLLFVLLFKGMQPDESAAADWIFCTLPAAVLLEAVFQQMKEFHLFFGVLVIGLVGVSIGASGLTVPHIVLILCVLIGCSLLSLSGALATGLWIGLSVKGCLQWLDILGRNDLGWLILVVLLLVGNRYFLMRVDWEKLSGVSVFWGSFLYDKLPFGMIGTGIILLLLQRFGVLTIPDIVNRMHLVRTGIFSLIGMMVFYWWDGGDGE